MYQYEYCIYSSSLGPGVCKANMASLIPVRYQANIVEILIYQLT